MANPLRQHDPSWWAEKRVPAVVQAIFSILLIAAFGFLVAIMLGAAG